MSNKCETLKVPSASALANVEKICSFSEPYKNSSALEQTFHLAMGEILEWHQSRSNFYRNFLQQHNFSVEAFKRGEKKLSNIPYIPAEFFKRNEVLSVSQQDVTLHLTSSGTSGQKSQIFFDAWSIGSAQRMVDWIFKAYGWVSEQSANYLLYSYQTEADSKLGTAYTDNFLCKYAPVNQVEYALKFNGRGGHDFDVFGSIRALREYAEQGKPVRIFGFPAFLYFTLETMENLKIQPLKLHPDSLVFLGGGWKGYANKEITKESLYQKIHSLLGIPDARLRDGFGSVEHCIPYVECAQHRFHVPVWSKVFIRDFKSLELLGYEQKGFLQFVSPYITSVPAHSVLMGDSASLHEHCDCGLKTPWFKIHGRAGTSKNKSCAVAASELLKKASL